MFSMMSNDIGIDLGTASILVYDYLGKAPTIFHSRIRFRSGFYR